MLKNAHVCIYLHMYVCKYVCILVCMRACTYVIVDAMQTVNPAKASGSDKLWHGPLHLDSNATANNQIHTCKNIYIIKYIYISIYTYAYVCIQLSNTAFDTYHHANIRSSSNTAVNAYLWQKCPTTKTIIIATNTNIVCFPPDLSHLCSRPPALATTKSRQYSRSLKVWPPKCRLQYTTRHIRSRVHFNRK